MKKSLIILMLLLFTTLNAQYDGRVNFGNSSINLRTEYYLPNSPTNTDGNRTVVGSIKGEEYFEMKQNTIRFTHFAGTGTRIVTFDNDGSLSYINKDDLIDTNVLATRTWVTSVIPATKRKETFSGTTSGSGGSTGTYTVVFNPPYTVAPNIQVTPTNASVTQRARVTSITNTGFTITTVNETLGLIFSTVNGVNVDVLINEK